MRILSLALAVLILSSHGVVQAQVQYQRANGKGKSVIATIDPSKSATPVRKVVFWFTVRGNVSQELSVTLNGPVRARASLQARILKGRANAALESDRGWYGLAMNEDDLVIKESSFATLAAKSCDEIPESVVQFVIDLYARIGQTATTQDICDFWMASPDIPATPTPFPMPDTPNYNYKHGWFNTRGVLQADTCGTRGTTQYLVRMVVNVDNVAADVRSGGYQLQASFSLLPYLGSQAASVKPESDGKFAPQPLLLMNSTGGFGSNEHVNVYSWRRGKPTMTQQLKVEDYVPYQGLMLARIVATPALRGGGRATFEITNGSYAYSVCFSRTRTRQKVNGYP